MLNDTNQKIKNADLQSLQTGKRRSLNLSGPCASKHPPIRYNKQASNYFNDNGTVPKLC